MPEPALSWVRLLVDDFAAAYATHRRTISAPSGERYAQLRKPDGTLMEIRVTWIPGFGSLVGASG